MKDLLNRLIANWVYGGFLAGALFLLLTPTIAGSWSSAMVSTFLCLPAYMVHQYEEHDKDRFRQVFNQTIGRGHEVLTPLVVFIANVPVVWGVVGLSIWLAATINIGFGLIASYLVIVNAIVHIVSTIVFRGYNPGLLTGVLVFLPLGGYGLNQIGQVGGGTVPAHLVGVGTALFIHAAILVHVRNNRIRLSRLSPPLARD